MKRLLLYVALIVAIGSIGGNILTTHAQTTTAELQQQLDVAKATLANLEMQAGTVPPTDSGAPATVSQTAGTGLTAEQVAEFSATLNTLAASLTQLGATVSTNTTLTPSQTVAVATTLNGMQNTLLAMANTIATANSVPNTAPVASAKPASSPVAVNNPAPAAPSSQTPTTAPAAAAPAVVAQTAPSAQKSAPQTAQASSIWSFTKAHWPTIVIVLLVIAILAILFWPEKETVKTVPVGTSGSGKPKSAPTTTVTMNQQTASNPPRPATPAVHAPSPATPVASAVAAPSQN
jgi:hypothetical protein